MRASDEPRPRSTSPAASSCARRRTWSAEDRVLLLAAARVVLAGDRGSLATQIDRSNEPAVTPAGRRSAERGKDSGEPGTDAGDRWTLPPDLRTPLRQRPRAASRRTAGSTSSARRRRPPTPARRRRRGSTSSPIPSFGFLVTESGARLHLGRQQPDQPPDALEQRPGLRPARRGRLPARRGDRRRLDADAAAAAAGRRRR